MGVGSEGGEGNPGDTQYLDGYDACDYEGKRSFSSVTLKFEYKF